MQWVYEHNYLRGCPSLVHKMTEFTICSRRTGLASEHIYLRFKVKDGCEKDVYYKNRTGHANCQLVDLDPFTFQKEGT